MRLPSGSFSIAFDIPATGAMLNFMTCYEIELDWDYGYVEVYDVDMDTWCTLPGVRTVDDVGMNYKTYNDNCPDEFEPTTYYDNGEWYAFTGSSGGWYQETMDLTPFAGHKIELYFTYWTDPAMLEAGFYIDDIEITEGVFFDDVEAGEGDWIVYDGWVRDNSVHDNDFEVNLITIKNFYDAQSVVWKSFKDISSIILDDETEAGVEDVRLFNRGFIEQYVVMVVANQPGYEHTFTTSYVFSATKK